MGAQSTYLSTLLEALIKEAVKFHTVAVTTKDMEELRLTRNKIEAAMAEVIELSRCK